CERESARAASSRATSVSTASAARDSRKTGAASRSTTSAGPMAMPGETPVPFSSIDAFPPSRLLPEAALHEPAQRLERLLFVLPVRLERERAPPGSGEQQDPEDRLPVHHAPVPHGADPRSKPVRRVHEPRRGAGVEAQPVRDADLPTGHAGFFSRI